MKSKGKGLSVLALIIIVAVILIVMVILLTFYNFNYNLLLKDFFKQNIQSNINNASRIIVKELKHSKEIEITDNNSKANFINLNEGSIYLENNIIKMKKGWKEENLTDTKTVIVDSLEFDIEDNIITFKIKGNNKEKDLKNKKKNIKEYSVELKFESLVSGSSD